MTSAKGAPPTSEVAARVRIGQALLARRRKEGRRHADAVQDVGAMAVFRSSPVSFSISMPSTV
ncbi:hypothetical protein CFN78_13510 [Amycolatopsis antarctica]|uniref:Uncharacterized protein n=1 Tax=Amycolatopsis antarctica TaxID=1854586 RepID=A0A263D3J1_9PSEU|nr:hypothetical protein CFN78_13510 [Amycolatopsis antarctica]